MVRPHDHTAMGVETNYSIALILRISRYREACSSAFRLSQEPQPPIMLPMAPLALFPVIVLASFGVQILSTGHIDVFHPRNLKRNTQWQVQLASLEGWME